MIALVAALFITMFMNVPLAISIGLSALLYIVYTDAAPLAIIAQQMVMGVNSFPLLAIPFFLLAGLIMAEAKLTSRIMDFASACVGRIPGGMPIVMVFVCMLFGAISGSAVADVVAIGTLLLPAMKENGYDPGFSASLLGCAGSLGSIVPPSLVMVIIGITLQISIGKLFLGGFIPGFITGGFLIVLSYFFSTKKKWEQGEFFSLIRVLKTFKDAILPLITPIIIIGGIISGIFTATESAIVAVAYALFLAIFVYRNLKSKPFFTMILSTVETSAAILLVISAASIFGWVLAAEQVPQRLANMILSITDNYYAILFLTNIIIIILGMFMETIAIIIIVVPVLMPILTFVGVDPVHFGVILTVNLAIGANTPPVAIDYLAACRLGGVRIEDGLKYIFPFCGAMCLALILLILFPSLVLFLPNYFMTN